MDQRSKTELQQENDQLRQLLQAGVMLAEAVLAGDDVTAELREWIDAVQAAFGSS